MAKLDKSDPWSDHVYDNTPWIKRGSCENKKPTIEKKWKPSFICVVVLAVLLFLSLVVNGILAFFYFTKDNASLHCEPVKNCSNADHEQVSQGCTYQEDWMSIKYCPDLPEKWFQVNGTFYLFSSYNRTWISSKDHCKALGGDLVIINNSQEQEFLSQRLCVTGESDLYWSGKTPQKSNQSCVVLKGNTQEHISCMREEGSICEFPCSP